MDTLINRQPYFAPREHSYQDSVLISGQGRKHTTSVALLQIFIFHTTCKISITLNNVLYTIYSFLMSIEISFAGISSPYPSPSPPYLLVHLRPDIVLKNMEAVGFFFKKKINKDKLHCTYQTTNLQTDVF